MATRKNYAFERNQRAKAKAAKRAAKREGRAAARTGAGLDSPVSDGAGGPGDAAEAVHDEGGPGPQA